jgi:hypothetical protein
VTLLALHTLVPLMRNTLLAALVLATAACGAYQFPGGTPSPNTGMVSGRVIAVPCAPVEPAGSACAGRPVVGLEIDFDGSSATKAAITDSNGGYSVELAPGTWKVRMKTYMRIISGPTSITVAAGSSVVANYILDSGIRAPVPQQ